MDSKQYIDRLLETENLTDELEDADAQRLLDWGVERLGKALEGIEVDELAAERCTALMGVVRKINRLVGARARLAPEIYVSKLEELDANYGEILGTSGSKATPADATATSEFSQMSASQSLDYLLQRFA